MALVLIRLGGSVLAFYKEHIVLFRSILPRLGSELSAVFFLLDSLFFEESSIKVSEIFSISWIGLGQVQQILLGNSIL